MRAQQIASIVVASTASLLAGSPGFGAAVDYFNVPSPVVLSQPMRTSYGKVLPKGTYFVRVEPAADGSLKVLLFDTHHILIGLSKAQFRGGGSARSIMETDKGSPVLPGSQGTDKQGQGKILPYIEPGSKVQGKVEGQPGSQAFAKIEGQPGSQAFAKIEGQPGSQAFAKIEGQPGSQGSAKIEGQEVADSKGGGEGSKGGGKGSYQTGGSAGQNHGLLLPAVQVARTARLPAGKSFAQLGFGVGSQARFQNNAVVIITGKPGTGEIIAVLTPAGR
jgi:hypothetical protein